MNTDIKRMMGWLGATYSVFICVYLWLKTPPPNEAGATNLQVLPRAFLAAVARKAERLAVTASIFAISRSRPW